MFKRIKKYLDDKKAEKERLEEEARIEAELKKEEARRKAEERRREQEEKEVEEEAKRIVEAQMAEEKRIEEENKKAHQDFLDKLQKEKELATAKGEPWVALLNMDVDYDDLNNGAFELDWNDAFVTRLMKFGYQGRTDADLVDQWFTDVCRNVVFETFEQAQADLHPVKRQDLGDGKREYK